MRASGGYNIPFCIIPLWDVDLAAQECSASDQGVRAFCFSELPHRLKLPTIHSGEWDPMFQVCNDNGVTLSMHIGSSSTNPWASHDAPGGVGGTLAFNNSMASLADWLFSGKLIQFPKLKLAYSEGQIGGSPTRSNGPTPSGSSTTAGSTRRNASRSRRRLLLRPHLRVLHRRPPRPALAARVGEDNICFETDYPHTDTTWPNSKEYVEKMLADFDDNLAYKVLRGNAIRMLELDRT